MIEFLKENLMWVLIGVLFAGFVLFRVIRTLALAKKIDREGVPTDAVVTKIKENWDPDTAGSSYTTYVRYRDEHGEMRESPMAITVRPEYAEGQQVRIRYIPGVHDLVREEKNE